MPMRKGWCVCWMALCLLVSGLAAAQVPSETPQAAEARLVQAAEAAVAQHGELSPEHFVALGALADHHYFLQNNAEWVALMQRLVDLRIRAHGPTTCGWRARGSAWARPT
jgi:hypothetical protein